MSENTEICYLCYDVKGIQQFIFSVPKLKYVVGASLLIADFDEKTKKTKTSAPSQDDKWTPIFAGGGKGTFECDNRKAAEELRGILVEEAHKNGLDLRVGIDSKLSEAMRHADDLYPFVPHSLEGEPCAVSGLWPVSNEMANASKNTKKTARWEHPLIKERANRAVLKSKDRKSDEDVLSIDEFIINELRQYLINHQSQLSVADALINFEKSVQKPFEFLTVVRDSSDLSEKERPLASLADCVLGGRNRWAVLSMDGNDMGAQFRAFESMNCYKPNFDSMKKSWMRKMSQALKDTTRDAFIEGLAAAVNAWWEDIERDKKRKEALEEKIQKADAFILPFRPLILGGDDILCICHSSYAMMMAETIIKAFHRISKEKEREKIEELKKIGIDHLWPGTAGALTISAGIAYTGVTLPLFLSIPYAESLLGSAKGKFRQKDENTNQEEKRPTPSAIDWESITESMIDTPSARRRRDLTFSDSDLGQEICLTMRPYRVSLDSNFEKGLDPKWKGQKTLDTVQKLKKEIMNYPRSFLAGLMTTLTRPWSERILRLAAAAVHHPKILDWLDEGIEDENKLGQCWQEEKNIAKRSNYFLDAVLLLEEEIRMDKGGDQ